MIPHSILRSKARHTLLLAAALATVTGCASPTTGAPPDAAPEPSIEELPVIQLIEGEFDGEDFSFRTLEREEVEARRDELGRAAEALIDLPSMSCSTCVGTNYVAFSTISASRRAITNGAAQGSVALWTSADTGNCGPVPTTGTCSQNRLRNLYPDQLERVYAELIELEPTGSTTSVQVPTQPYGAANDFGVFATVPNGLWRFGEIGRSSPAANGPTTHWAFTGTTPPGTDFTFRFLVQVRGLVVRPTQRATVAHGQRDQAGAAGYVAATSGTASTSSNIALSGDGRYAAFVTNSPALTGQPSGNFVVRKDLQTGALDVVNPAACTTLLNPDLSFDGSVLVFAAGGATCDPAGLGATSVSPQIYAHDFRVGQTQLVSHQDGQQGVYASGVGAHPRVSDDGTVVVFQSNSTDLVLGMPGTRSACPEVYRYDLGGFEMRRVSVTRDANPYDPADGWAPTCSASAPAGETPDVNVDGSMIVFASSQPLDPNDTYSGRDIYVYDHFASMGGAAVVYRVSLTPSGGDFNAASLQSPTISADGTTVAFATMASNIAGTTTGRRHIYRRSAYEGDDSSIRLVSRTVAGNEGGAPSPGIPALSDGGRFVAFWSNATDLASEGTFSVPASTQLYVCDMGATTPTLGRCWVASTLQVAAGGAFDLLTGSTATGFRIGFAYPNDLDAGYVAYQATPSWALGSGAGTQVFVSPVGDPRYQQAPVRP